MNIDLAYTELDSMTFYDPASGNFLFELDELQNATVAQGEETVDITGKNGRKITRLKRNKTVTISGTNGLVSGGLLARQVGSGFENKVATVHWTDYLTVTSNTAETRYVAIGNTGNEIKSVQIRDEHGFAGESLTQDATATDSTKFAYNPATKQLTFSGITDGTSIVVRYDRQIQADVITNNSNNYSGKVEIYIDITGEDKCSNVYHAQVHVPKADFNGEFSMELGGDQTVHSFEAEALVAGACGASSASEDILWTWTVFGENAADYVAQPVVEGD